MTVANRVTRTFIENGQVSYYDVTWEAIREARDQSLKETDWWALKDLTLTAKRREYRQFLRDMPANYETANEAADAWSEYDIPE